VAEHARADLGLVCALPLEVQELLKRCVKVRSYGGGDFTFRGGRYDNVRLVIVEAGTGQARARRATQALIDGHDPTWILSVGFAGAIQPGLKIGQILVPNRLVSPGAEDIHVDVSFPSQPERGWHVGGLLTVDRIVRTIAEKQSLAAETNCQGVDMESYAVAEVCKAQRKRFFGVRVFSDDLSADLPAEVLSLMGPTGAVRYGAVLGALWKRPGSAQEMWNMREQAIAASGQLANFLDGVIRQLHAATAATK
jgi:adenosylhomocysteine nucleosidase